MYKVFDSETETHHSFKRKSNPFDPRNYVVMRGWKNEGDKRCSMSYHKSKTPDNVLVIEDDVDVLVGHNIKFDLLYEMCNDNQYLKAFYKRGGRVWCTQYAHYLLNAMEQKAQMAAMDQIIEGYGGRKKIDGLKAMWNAGILTSEIDPALLEDYLIGTAEEGRNSGDVGNTELMYLAQIKMAEELGMTAMIKARMDGLCGTTEMEFNGLKIDVGTAKLHMTELMAEQATIKERLEKHVSFIPEEVGFSWTSGVHMSCLLFGGTIRYEKRTTYIDEATGELARLKAVAKWPYFNGKERNVDNPRILWDEERQLHYTIVNEKQYWQDTFQSGKKIGVGKYKNVNVQGELKIKYQDFFYELPRMTEPQKDWETKLVDGMGKPCYSTDKDTVAELGLRDIPFLKDYSRNASLDKELGTYYARYDPKKKEYVGMLTCVDPATRMVHHSLNHCNTVTSRLSSNNPNMQNLPRADKSRVKQMFVSRFGADGVNIEMDYSQLEVVVQGLLSGDKNLQRDLIAQIDFHCKRVSAKFGVTYEEALDYCKNETNGEIYKVWKPRRTGVKEFSFQRAYGAGAPAIAFATGMPLEDVKQLIENEDAMYPGVKKFNEAVMREIERSAEAFRDPERGWKVYRRGYWQAPTGTMYSFRSYDAQAFLLKTGITDTFMPTEAKNYPIQGTGGEIVQMVLGVLWRWFVKNDNFGGMAFLVNTVHDCYWADTHKSVTDQVAAGMHKIITAVPQLLKAKFGMDCPVPFPSETEVGPNMYDLKHYHGASA